MGSNIALMGLAGLTAVAGVSPAHGQLPFAPGERITYSVYVKGAGTIGHATMSVEGPVDVRGVATYLLRSQTNAGVGPFKGTELSESWLDPVGMKSLRFHEKERRFFRTRSVKAEIYPDEKRWTTADGASGKSLTASPLDELSFIYFLRSLALSRDTSYAFDRHYDAARNPVVVRIARGDTLKTAIGVVPTVLVEMHVRDPRRYSGDGMIRIYISDDDCRVPVRIDSSVPGIGSLVLTLESYSATAPGCAPGSLAAHAAAGRQK